MQHADSGSTAQPPAAGSKTSPDDEQRGEAAVHLNQTNAGDCAALLEMLYVPVGRSGSADETYLLYQEIAEFEKAVAIVPLLDVGMTEANTAVTGWDGAFRAGIARLIRIVAAGPDADRGMIDECEHDLAQVVQSSQASPQLRWAAGILLGRLVSDHRYDFGNARIYLKQAERAAAPQTIENMTARWWLADSYVQEGRRKDANDLYAGIMDDFADQWKNSAIVQRSREAVTGRKK